MQAGGDTSFPFVQRWDFWTVFAGSIFQGEDIKTAAAGCKAAAATGAITPVVVRSFGATDVHIEKLSGASSAFLIRQPPSGSLQEKESS